MMKGFTVLAAFVLVYQPCTSRSLNEEDSVVSVYTTNPTTAGTPAHLDVYRQIADNIAERITQPIYRFFGFGNNTAEEKTKRQFEHIELDSSELVPPITTDKNNSNSKTKEINPNRDIEELSTDSQQKTDKKPEKITLFSSYLPVNVLPLTQNIEVNETSVETNDKSLELDDVYSDDIDLNDIDRGNGREGPFVYILELFASIIQLLWGGFLTLFKPAASSSSEEH